VVDPLAACVTNPALLSFPRFNACPGDPSFCSSHRDARRGSLRHLSLRPSTCGSSRLRRHSLGRDALSPFPLADPGQRLPFPRRHQRRGEHGHQRDRRPVPAQRAGHPLLGRADQGRGRRDRGQRRKLQHPRQTVFGRRARRAQALRERAAEPVRQLRARECDAYTLRVADPPDAIAHRIARRMSL